MAGLFRGRTIMDGDDPDYVNRNLKVWLSGRTDGIFSSVGSAFVFLMPYNSHVLAFWDVPAA
jgi:hypothetical protein